MYTRLFNQLKNQSFFLFGPRGTGKSSWLREYFSEGSYIDLLDTQVYRELSARPERLVRLLDPTAKDNWYVIDEIQLVPELMNEVHRLIEERGYRFALSGSSARKLKSKGTNLLAGRAITEYMHPFTPRELGDSYCHDRALRHGLLPQVWDKYSNQQEAVEPFLNSYVTTYLKEEIQQEGLSRNIGTFSRFLEIASFSQASPLVVSNVAREVNLDAKTVENYFSILEDLLLARRIPSFAKHAKRELFLKPKFFFFDVGVYRAIRPRGPLDRPEQIDGAALETILFQQLTAYNDYYRLSFDFYYWRTRSQLEVDLVLYGSKGIFAFEVKRSDTIREADLKGVRAFAQDYPIAKIYVLHGGEQSEFEGNISFLPFERGVERFLAEVVGTGKE